MDDVSTARPGPVVGSAQGNAHDGSRTGEVVLADGRRLAYAEHGPASGRPVLYFHGTPGSKHNWFLNHAPDVLEALGLRVFAIDRPGMGGSTYRPGRTLGSWPDDVRAFADRRGLDRFAVLGYSCGAPYALACAVHLADRVSHASLVSGCADVEDPELASLRSQENLRVLRLGVDRPLLSRLAYRTMGAVARFAPGTFVRQALTTMPPADGEVLRRPEVRRAFLEMLRETLRNGPRGAQLDSAIVSSAWHLPLEEIVVPVTLWHGSEDRNAPPIMARHLAGRIPGAVLHLVPGEGHLSLVHRHVARVLQALPGAVAEA